MQKEYHMQRDKKELVATLTSDWWMRSVEWIIVP
jgi:hypothetical protein